MGNVLTLSNNVLTSGGNVLIAPTMSYTLLASQNFEVSTTSTSYTNVGTISCPLAWTDNSIIYTAIRDTAGPRSGYFTGTDNYLMIPDTSASSSYNYTSHICISKSSSTNFLITVQANTSGYGIFPESLTNEGILTIRARYNSNYCKSIDGTYIVNVYKLDYAPFAGGNPFNYSFS